MLRSAAGRATAIVFMASGILTGTLSSRWPWLAGRLHLSSGVIGALGLASTAGALVTMPFAARFVHRYGAQGGHLGAHGGHGHRAGAAAVRAGRGRAGGDLRADGRGDRHRRQRDEYRRAWRRRSKTGTTIMSGLHGMWSVGVLVGALAGSLAAKVGLDPRIQFTVMGALIAVSGVASAPWLAGDPVSGSAAEADVPKFVWPRGLVLLIGLVAFAAIFVEFAASSWAALFMHWTLHTSQAVAALATAVFALAMAAGRLAGDYVVGRGSGAVRSVRVCGVLGTAGCLLVAVAPDTWLAPCSGSR